MSYRIFLGMLCGLAMVAVRAVENPFGAKAEFTSSVDALMVRVELTGPAGGHFDAGYLRMVLPKGYDAELVNPPKPVPDELFEDGVYMPGTVLNYKVTPGHPVPELSLTVQGCVDEMCYMPQTVKLAGILTEASANEPGPAEAEATPENWFRGFAREELTLGYAKTEDFIAWLDSAVSDGQAPAQPNLLVRVAEQYGLWLAALLLLPLGMLLNLTPCVLPMIPVTLAVLGAKSAGGGRRRGFLLGAIYGGAMAIAYGLVGAVFVMLGGRFGGINASPWFNWAVGIVMICLALSMFDIFLLDLSRFRKVSAASGGGYGLAAFLGATSALLAGACVAPVLIWVLLFSAQLYGGGHSVGLWLPFLLGAGLGLPWPLLGAGLGFLPKPGGWMTRVKQAFGVLILLFACHYLWNGFQLMRGQATVENNNYWRTDIAAAVAESRAEGRPLLVDFWGVTCKACATMEATTLRDPAVRQRIDRMTRLKIQADDFDDPALEPVLEHFQIPGLPAYVILIP